MKCLVNRKMLLSERNLLPRLAKCFWRSVLVRDMTASLALWWPKFGFQRKIRKFSNKSFVCTFSVVQQKQLMGLRRAMYPGKSGHYKPLLLNKMDGERWCWFLVLLKNMWGCLSKGGWCCAKGRCCHREGRHQRVSQTTDSQTGVQRKSLKSLSDA